MMSNPSQQQYQKRQTVTDEIGEWLVNEKGEHYINVENAKISDEGFKKKLIRVFNNDFDEADDVEEQESRNGFNYNGKTYHINQFKGFNGKQISTVRKGPATRPDDGLLIMPTNFLKQKTEVFGKQTTFSQGTGGTGSTGGYKSSGNKKSWNNWSNNKSQNNNNLKRVDYKSPKEIDAFLQANPEWVKPSEQHHSPKSNWETGETEYCVGIPA